MNFLRQTLCATGLLASQGNFVFAAHQIEVIVQKQESDPHCQEVLQKEHKCSSYWMRRVTDAHVQKHKMKFRDNCFFPPLYICNEKRTD